MAKQINTRIQLKHDSLTNWNESSIVLKPGEFGVAYVDVATKDAKGNIIHVPTALLKVGENVEDSTKTFKDLPFVSAIAADVYAWAKKEGIEVIDEGEGEVLSDIAWDATQQALVLSRIDVITPAELTEALKAYYTKTEIDGLFAAEVERANAYADQAEADAIAAANAYTDAEIEKITTGAGYATTKYVDDAVAAHETAVNTKFADYSTTEQMNAAIDADVLVETNRALAAEEALGGRIDAVSAVADAAQTAEEVGAAIDAKITALDLANTYDAKGAAAAVAGDLAEYETANNAAVALKANAADVYTKDEADAAFMTQDEVDARVNQVITDAVEGDTLTSLTELVEYINAHGGEAAEMALAIDAIEKQLDGIDVGTGTVKKYIDDAIAALKIGDYATAADLAALAARVKAIEDAPYATTANVATAKQEAIEAAAADATAKANQALADAKADAEGKYETKGTAQGIVDALNLANTYETIAGAAEKYETKGTAQGIVDALKLAETYEPIGAEARATAAAATDATTKANAAQAAAEATAAATYRRLDTKITSDDLSDEVFVFNCGTATTVL